MGVEVELTGPDVAETAAVLVEVLEGQLEIVSPYEHVVRDARDGPWRVELDFHYLLEKGRERTRSEEPPSLVGDLSERIVRKGAEAVVPVEVVSPPLPIARLVRMQQVVHALRRFGAQGTRAGITHAFGMQLNPEMPRCDARTILCYLRAFLCLQDWLLRESRIDLTRRITGYSASFPTDYVRRVIDPAYAPDLPRLIDDYLEANPTRNRALDLLPLFTDVDPERVGRVVADERVKPRPALHYRLPNCEIDDPDWGIHVAWKQWLQVEHLAADEERLNGACRDLDAFLGRPIDKLFGDWAEEVERWLTPARSL